jgi:hypothetical protein
MSTTNLSVKSETAAHRNIFSSSVMVWLFLIAYLLVVKTVILPLFPPLEIDAVAMIFSWGNIVVFIILAIVWLADRCLCCPRSACLEPPTLFDPAVDRGSIGTLGSCDR